MAVTMREIIQRRLEASEFPERLPSVEEGTDVDKDTVQSKFPPLSEEMIAALAAAARALRASDVGKVLASRALDMTPQEILRLAADVSRLPEMRQAVALAKGPDVFASEKLGDDITVKELITEYAPQSLVINFSALLDLGVGLTGYIGFAIDLDNMDKCSIIIGGAVGVGLSAIIGTGQGVGLSANMYSDMTGTCLGASAGAAAAAGVLIDGSIGYSVPYLPVIPNVHPNQWTVIVYALEGAGEDIGVYVGFTLVVINTTMPDIIQPPGANSTTISSITCLNTEDTVGKDELYFQVKTDIEENETYRYPLWDYFSINEDTSWNIGFTINFNNCFKLTLYNNETSGANTIHTFEVSADAIPAPGNTKTLHFDNGETGMFENRVIYDVELYTP